MSQPTGREPLELLVGLLVLAAGAAGSYFIGHAIDPDDPVIISVFVGGTVVFFGVIALVGILTLALTVGAWILGLGKPKAWDGSGAPDDL